MNPLHVVAEIPPAGKPITRDSSVAGRKMTEIGILAMPMHTVRFPLMAEETCIRGEMGIRALAVFATVWLQMGVQVFASCHG
jgi:hypothetical protein